jgi:hypothetical protein
VKSLARSFYTTAVATEHYLGITWPRAIWQAVLEQAIRDIVEGPHASELRHLSLAEVRAAQHEFATAAQHWVDDQVNEPRRFVWVCEQLGLEPDAVRREILNRKGKP